MKSGKAVGPDDIPVEVWKCLGEAAVEFLTSLFNKVLESERMPEEWRRSVLVPIFKNKGDVQSCSNYRGIKLMSHTMKLWERVVEARLRKVVEICEQQYGFMPRKSTTDAIFALRILMEKYRDGQRELHCVFVDLEKAYDRVPREELWYCMRKSGVAEKYVRVVQDMYERSRTVVRCAVGQTKEFKVEVGLHQGSALSPFLFAIVMDQLSEKFFADPCASDPCLHGNCTRQGAEFVCECSDGYAGVRCEQPPSAFDLVESSWDLAATPATTTQPSQPITELSDTEAPPTLQPWQPKPGQRVIEVQWEELQITDGSECVSIAGTEPAGMMTVSMEIAEGTAVKLVLNISGAAALWRVGALGFDRCSVSDGMVIWFQQDSNGLVISDQLLPLGHNYFITVLRIGTPSGLEVTLRLQFTVKSTSCMEPGSNFSDPQCTGRGKCITQSSVSTFYCQCDVGYSGIFCEEFDACYTNPCENNGTCSDITQRHERHDYTCTCLPGYHGLYCEEEYNECLSAPCQNFATCRDLINAYECLCTPQYTGRHCEIYQDPCAKLQCQNGGQCERRRSNATCVCAPGYTGENCETDFNECESNPCHHGGTCIDQADGFLCHCPPGWVGGACEILVYCSE
ncbi:hypothetical protein QTP70_001661 [Hemibagrus guttatus]|uniref:Uncharacterized protein n=1 Tax=Hemibagrus guttatus TaxID=175788 RepID=A0AAE0R9Y6_9TELE|nr:hypothetical protein QTP70_001661 [Hemibagrus guttatus]